MRILLTGGTGQIGWELQRTLPPLGEVVAPTRETLDLTDPDAIRDAVREWTPDLIVNAAAFTDVDRAEEEPELARLVNGVAPGILAEEAHRIGAFLVHYSTDYVFDGRKREPYGEDDETNPLNVYGETKLQGEEAVRAAGTPHLMLRTSWVYGLRRRNFLTTMLRLFLEREEVRVVDDQVGCPTWCRLVAEATLVILSKLGIQPNGGSVRFAEWGSSYHLSASGEASWYGFAQEIRNRLRGGTSEVSLRLERIEPIETGEYPSPARRPAYSVLSNERVQRSFNFTLPTWERHLDLCLASWPKASNST